MRHPAHCIFISGRIETGSQIEFRIAETSLRRRSRATQSSVAQFAVPGLASCPQSA